MKAKKKTLKMTTVERTKPTGGHPTSPTRITGTPVPSPEHGKKQIPSRTGGTRPQKSNSKKQVAKQKDQKPARVASTTTSKKKVTRPRTSKQYFTLPNAQQETWNRITHVISKMRSEGTSLTQASREFGLDPRVVKNRAGSALRKSKNGRYVARPSDKLLRVLVIPSPDGLMEVAVRSSDIASKIGEYNAAVQRYLRTGDASRLKKFRRLKLLTEKGKRIKLVTDLAELQKLGSAGVLSFESLYRSAA